MCCPTFWKPGPERRATPNPGYNGARQQQDFAQGRIADDRDDAMAQRRHDDQPWQHSKQRPSHVVDKLDRAGARREVDESERRKRHNADRSDGKHTTADDHCPDAIKARPHHISQRTPPELCAERVGGERAGEHANSGIQKSEPRTERSRRRRDQDHHRERHQSARHEYGDHQRSCPRLACHGAKPVTYAIRVSPAGKRRHVPGSRQQAERQHRDRDFPCRSAARRHGMPAQAPHQLGRPERLRRIGQLLDETGELAVVGFAVVDRPQRVAAGGEPVGQCNERIACPFQRVQLRQRKRRNALRSAGCGCR